LVIHHQYRIGTRADHALNGRSDEDVAQQLLAVSAHHNEVHLHRLCGAQNAGEWVSGSHCPAATDSAQFGYYVDLLVENPSDFSRFDLDQLRRQIIIYDVYQREFRVIRLRQKAGPPQCPVGSG
jgi:hypothetical protein